MRLPFNPRRTQRLHRWVTVVLTSMLWHSPGYGQAAKPPDAGTSSITLEYIAHASFRLEAGGTSLVLDPFASRVWLGYDFPADVKADALAVTHPHYDHDAGDRRGTPSPWPDGVPTIRDPGKAKFGPFVVLGIEGKHSDPYGKEFDQKNTIMVVEVAGIRIVHLGDNGPLTPKMIASIGHVDVLMIPIDATEHILKNSEVEDIVRALRPRVLIPMHYRLPDLEPGDGPTNLGPIDPWLKGRGKVRRMGNHRTELSASSLPELPEIWVFDHSPALVRPAD